MEVTALVVVVVGLSAFVVVRHYDLTNPYRDGTTHTATLRFETTAPGSVCLQNWSATLASYTWYPVDGPPWGETSVKGKLHIIDSQHFDRPPHGPAATFTARGTTIDLMGGKRPEFDGLACSIVPNRRPALAG
jgi:hypothetical protein